MRIITLVPAALRLILLMAGPGSRAAAAQGTDIFERLRGEWHGVGTLLGRPARFAMRWQDGGGFAVLTFSNAFVDTAGNATPVLNVAAVYRTSPGKPEAVWLDSRGVRIEIRWQASDSVLVADWTAPTERGRTTYRARSANELEVVDEVLSGETWRTFATARFTRAPGAGAQVRRLNLDGAPQLAPASASTRSSSVAWSARRRAVGLLDTRKRAVPGGGGCTRRRDGTRVALPHFW